MESTMTNVSRRSLLAGVALGGAALGMGAMVRRASADEPGAFTFADTVAWDAQYDVVVLGMGFAGMASAMAAADAGATVLLCEKAPDGHAGGNSRVCGQMFANGYGDPETARQYYTALTAGRKIPDDMLEILVNGVAGMEDRLADRYGMDRSLFTDQTETFGGWMSPEYPEFPGSEKIRLWATQPQYGSSLLYQYMRDRILANYIDKIDVWFEAPGTKLIQDPETKTIVGVVVERNGEQRNVRAVNGVCVCTGGFECNREMVQNFLGLTAYSVAGGQYNDGDGILMCQAAGARLWHANVYEGTGCGRMYTEDKFGCPALPGTIFTSSSMCVGGLGRRFFDETLKLRHGHVDLGNGTWECPQWPEKFFVLFDQAHMDEINEAGGFSEDCVDGVIACADVAEAAAAIGCDEAVLQETIDNFNAYAEEGCDHAFHRNPATMRALDGQAYYVVRCIGGVLNTQGGPERNADAQIVDVEGNPIPHLYSSGEMGGITSGMYQGGTNVAECFIFGEIAGTNAAAAKDPLPAYVALTPAECVPAGLGDETDLVVETAEAGVNADGALTGTGRGIGGKVPVTVTLDADGKIASVEVGENAETEGIGSKAIEQLPAQFVGLSTAEEIDAVDGVSGATVTSDALKDAVKMAMGL